MGPRVGMPTLKPLFPEVPRTALKSMLHRFRDVRLYYEQKGMYTLTWTRPGAVWAMDHKDRVNMPIVHMGSGDSDTCARRLRPHAVTSR